MKCTTGSSKVYLSGIKRCRRWNSSKPFYITTPIFYVNAKPHLGHLYSMLLSDTRNRWEKLNHDKKSFFLTGTDEHGLKIQTVAEQQGIDPKKLVDTVSQNFKELANKAGIKYDRFIRTTDKDHIEAVQYFWNLMVSKDMIYKGSHSGWYSISDETFYPDNQIMEVIDPKTKEKKMISKETKSEVVYQKEENYFFKLSQFQENLISFLEENPNFIRPQIKYNELLTELRESQLTDLSVSRPSSRLKWGIEVPTDSSQRIYVWFDALLNYLTAAGFPKSFEFDTEIRTLKESPWPACHVIGKDIIRFHCIYWPIFLMAAGIELPKQVIVHSHWLCDGFKMSKSLGNVVDPVEMCEYYGEDTLRFFLTEYSNIESDCNFSEQSLHFTRENIIGKYANLVTRCGGPAFNIEESIDFFKNNQYDNIDTVIENYCLNKNKEVEAQEIIEHKNNLIRMLDNLHLIMNSKIIEFDHMKAIQEWWGVIELSNLLFQLSQPWLYKKYLKDPNTPESIKKEYRILQNYYVFLAAETCRITSILITPVMPNLSSKILERLDVQTNNINLQYCGVGKDLTYGKNANSKKHIIPIERIPIRTNDSDKK